MNLTDYCYNNDLYGLVNAINKGGNINEINIYGENCLTVCCKFNLVGIFRELLTHDNLIVNNPYLLQLIYMYKRYELLELLILRNDINLNCQIYDQISLLQLAVYNDDYQFIEILVKSGKIDVYHNYEVLLNINRCILPINDVFFSLIYKKFQSVDLFHRYNIFDVNKFISS